MTFKDKWYSEHPGTHFNPYLMRCPYSYGYEEKRDRPCRNDGMTCADCWEREIPDLQLLRIKKLPFLCLHLHPQLQEKRKD